MKIIFKFGIFLLLFINTIKGQSLKCTDFVNTFIGTTANGHTFPGVGMPFGLVQVSPETNNIGWNYCSGYNYTDSTMIGFAQDHLNGTGVGDLGDVLLFPFSGNADLNSYKSHYDKKTEKSAPGFYKVSFTDFGVDIELTATNHTAFHKYTFNRGNAHILLDLQSGISNDENSFLNRVQTARINFETNKIISGHQRVNMWITRELFYVIEFSRPYKINKEITTNSASKAKRYVLDFDAKAGESVLIKVALSTVSVEGAKLNLKTENSGWNFSAVKNKANNEWNKILSRVIIKGSKNEKESFYTSLYHLYLQPGNIADVDGQYRGANDSVFKAASKQYYSTFSLWDTYRAAHPLYTILVPERVNNMIQSLVEHYKVIGYLPIWPLWGKETNCMIGNHAIPVIADAYLKGFRGFNVTEAYAAIKATATTNHFKSNWDTYMKYGYFPFDLEKDESVSRTLENSMDDYSASLFAKQLGKTKDYKYFVKRSNFYKNLFDPTTKFMRGKDSNGKWRTPFDPLALAHAGTAGGDYTEANAWQYTWHVQQDVPGLIKLFGSREAFSNKLDTLFKLDTTRKSGGFSGDVTGLIGQYAHGNEPSHHVAYLFALLGKPWRTQELVREINDKFYLNKPDGLCGNDDCGQMSAWYIFTAMGFYPVNPVGGQYVLGAPQLPQISILLPGNKTFTVIAKDLSQKNKYVQRITLNEKPYNKLFINHKDIVKGGTLKFFMCEQPIISDKL